MRKSREDGLYSQEYIMEALNKLLCEHKFQDITVTDICQKAGVARVTFYKYYQSIYDVMAASANANTKHLLERFADLDSYDNLQIMIEYSIEELIPMHMALKNLIDSNMSSVLLDYFNYAVEAITQANTTVKPNLTRTEILFLAGGMFNIITDWIKGGLKESPESLAVKIYEILSLIQV